MIPLHLEMSNFMCYAGASLSFDAIHLACLTGQNGHGKSAILDAMTWALWGKARTQRDDDLMRLGETEMWVQFDFALGPNRYRVLRQRHKVGRGTSTLQFQIREGANYRALTGDTMRDTQDLIIKTLRMEYETFINSAFLVQGRADEFTTKAPAERKKVLADILDLSLYDTLEERAKERSREANQNLQLIEAAIAQMEQELALRPEHERELETAEADAKSLTEELKAAQEKLAELREKGAELEQKRAQLEGLGKELSARTNELAVFEKRIAAVGETDGQEQVQMEEIRRQLEALAELDPERANLQVQIEGLSNEQTALNTANAQLKREMDKLKSEIGVLTGAEAKCPTCRTALTEEHRDEVLAEMEAEGKEKADLYRENAARLKDAGTECGKARDALGELEAKLRAEKALREREVALTQALAEAASQKERLAEWEEGAGKLREALEEGQEKRVTLTVEVEALERIARDVNEERRKANDLDILASRAAQQVGAAKQRLDHCDYLEKQKKERQAERDQEGARWTLYEELKVAFGKRGIQAMIIEAAIPEIEEEANKLLSRMTDGMHVQLKSQRETQKGDIRETLDIEVADSLGPRDYGLFSGGEAFRINFAIRIAISKLLARRAGAQLRTLIIDEGFGTQDASGRERLVEAIASVADDFSIVLVVTHVDELKDAFPVRIDVFKTPQGSQIEVS